MIKKVYEEISNVLKKIDETELDAVKDIIKKDKRVFVTGAGRNGLQGKGFAMRLMHIGYEVYAVGDINTPAIQADDILIGISGSGTTGTVLYIAEKASAVGAQIVAVTSNSNSLLSKLADATITIPAATRDSDEVSSIQLLSTLFDQSVHILLDIVALKIAQRDGKDNEFAKTMHSNLE